MIDSSIMKEVDSCFNDGKVYLPLKFIKQGTLIR